MSSLAWTVCPHGAGHAVRSLRVLAALLADAPTDLDVALAIHPTTVALLGPPHTDVLVDRRVTVIDHVLDPASSDRADVAWLTAWLPRWAADARLAAADVVVSDNLTAPLNVRPDTVLLGSFLWSDVVGHLGGAAAAFAADEDALLSAHRPRMLTTADVAHPGTVRADAVGLPWFADRPPAGTATHGVAARSRIGLTGGATGRAEALFARARDLLTTRTDVEVVRGTPDCDVVVCRPGLGTVTDAVRTATPMVLLHEPGDPELDHTAGALVDAGLAVDAGDDPAVAVDAALGLRAGARREAMVAALATRPTGGHRHAARLIAERLG